jgi:TRAP-type C4-dicarboxylate transport system permease small subunit
MDQVASLFMALGGTWSLAHSLNMRSHVRIDVVSNLFPRALNRYCQIFAFFAMGLFATVLAVQTAVLAYSSYEIGALVPQSMIHFPLALPQALTVVGFGLLAIQAFLTSMLALSSDELPDGETQEAV